MLDRLNEIDKRGIGYYFQFTLNDYDGFCREGSFEKLSVFGFRSLAGQLIWALPVFYFGGTPYLFSWYSSIFLVMCSMRYFNYAGHHSIRNGQPSNIKIDSQAVNQKFYGYFGSEWHSNHHRYPRSANCSFEVGQTDLAFQIIRGLRAIGIVSTYRNDTPEARLEP